MGTTHRLYRLKERNVSLSEIFSDIKLINDSLCIGNKMTFVHRFNLKSPEIAKQLSSIFEINFHRLYSTFSLSEYDKLLGLLDIVPSCQRISFSNKSENTTIRNYLHYRMEIEQSGLRLSIIPSITEDFSLMKRELIETLGFLRTHQLIKLNNEELISLVKNLIDTNLIPEGRFLYESNGIEFSANADFIPKGSNEIRPSEIRLKFDDEYIESNGGIIKASKKIYEGLSNIFNESKYKIEGSISSDYSIKTYEILSNLNFLDFNIHSYMDLIKNSNFTSDHLKLTSIYGGSITIDNFDWKNSEPNHLDNRIYLELNNLNDWDFQIEIAKQINEEYYFNIELLINKELEYLGLE